MNAMNEFRRILQVTVATCTSTGAWAISPWRHMVLSIIVNFFLKKEALQETPQFFYPFLTTELFQDHSVPQAPVAPPQQM